MKTINIWHSEGEQPPLVADVNKQIEITQHLHMALNGHDISAFVKSYEVRVDNPSVSYVTITLVGKVVFAPPEVTP